MLQGSRSSKTLSVVIVNYNVCDYVLEAIQSLYQFVDNPLQIIVVDNHSSDNSVKIIQEKLPQVLIIENKRNHGFSGANNQGFEKCHGEYILMFNPDAVLIDGSINLMITELEKHQGEDVLIGPK